MTPLEAACHNVVNAKRALNAYCKLHMDPSIGSRFNDLFESVKALEDLGYGTIRYVQAPEPPPAKATSLQK